MPTIALQITVTTPPQPGASVAVITPNPVTIEAGKSATVRVELDDGTTRTPWAGAIVPFWGLGANGGIVATAQSGGRILIEVAATVPAGNYALQVDAR